MSVRALNYSFLSVFPPECDSRVPVPLCFGVARVSPTGVGKKAMDTVQCKSHAAVPPQEEADRLNLPGGGISSPAGPGPGCRTLAVTFGQPPGAAEFGDAIMTVLEEGSLLTAEGCGSS